jgi:hypothetical protein
MVLLKWGVGGTVGVARVSAFCAWVRGAYQVGTT